MASTDVPRLLLVHAHPDDESLDNGATMAATVARGCHVTLVTCTRGEEGEVIGQAQADLVSSLRDELGPYRERELAAAMSSLGVTDQVFLGGPGRYRDTGMVVLPNGRAAIPPEVRPDCFAVADPDCAAEQLAELIRDRRPHVVVTYEPGGGYGHPDHVMAHRVTLCAVDRAATGTNGWQVPKVYATVRSEPSMRAWLTARAAAGRRPASWDPAGPLPSVFVPDDQITAVVDARQQLGAKAAALRAHASQIVVLDGRREPGELALSNGVPVPWSAVEQYRLLRGDSAGPLDAQGRETDLFAGAI